MRDLILIVSSVLLGVTLAYFAEWGDCGAFARPATYYRVTR